MVPLIHRSYYYVPLHFFFNDDQKPNPYRLGVVVVVVVVPFLSPRSASSLLSQRPVSSLNFTSLSKLSFVLPTPSVSPFSRHRSPVPVTVIPSLSRPRPRYPVTVLPAFPSPSIFSCCRIPFRLADYSVYQIPVRLCSQCQ